MLMPHCLLHANEAKHRLERVEALFDSVNAGMNQQLLLIA